MAIQELTTTTRARKNTGVINQVSSILLAYCDAHFYSFSSLATNEPPYVI